MRPEVFWVERPGDLLRISLGSDRNSASFYNDLTRIVIVIVIILFIFRYQHAALVLFAGLFVITFIYYNTHRTRVEKEDFASFPSANTDPVDMASFHYPGAEDITPQKQKPMPPPVRPTSQPAKVAEPVSTASSELDVTGMAGFAEADADVPPEEFAHIAKTVSPLPSLPEVKRNPISNVRPITDPAFLLMEEAAKSDAGFYYRDLDN